MAVLRVLGLIALMAAQPLKAAPVYPANPFLTERDVFVSVDGVIRLEHESLHPIWFALEGLETDAPVVSREIVMVGTNAGMFALDIESGMMLWHIPSATTLLSPAVSDGTAFVSGSDGSIQAVDIVDGKSRWRRSLKGALFTPALTEKRLVVGGKGATLWALDRKDGSDQWRLPLGHEMAARPVADETGRIYLCTMGGLLMSVDSTTGKPKWKHTLSAPGSVLVDGERLYVGQLDGEVSARRREGGQVLWEKSFPDLDTAPLRILGDTLVVTTSAGENLFLDPASGDTVQPPREDPAPESPEDPIVPDTASEDVLVNYTR